MNAGGEKKMNRGLFIDIESCEAGGKGTVSKFVKTFNFPNVVFTREPGGTDFAEDQRKILLARRNYSLSPRAELLGMCAARADHLDNFVVPKLNSGVHVITERFRLSTRAYQIHGRQRPDLVPLLDSIERQIIKADPDLTIFLDADVEASLVRMKKQGRELDRIELEEIDFHKRVYAGYMVELDKVNHIKVNTNPLPGESVDQTIERVCKEVLRIVTNFLEIKI